MKVALYIRVSTESQNPEMQINELKAYCESRGWEIYQIFIDKLSGKNTQRPQFLEMNRLARLRKFQGIAIWRLDRAFRSTVDTINQIEEYNNYGIKFISLHDNFIDTTSPSGVLMINIVSCFAEFERKIIALRVQSGIANAKKKGVIFGRKPKVDLQKVIQLKESGLNLSEIAKQFNVDKSTISRVMKNFHQKLKLNESSKD